MEGRQERRRAARVLRLGQLVLVGGLLLASTTLGLATSRSAHASASVASGYHIFFDDRSENLWRADMNGAHRMLIARGPFIAGETGFVRPVGWVDRARTRLLIWADSQLGACCGGAGEIGLVNANGSGLRWLTQPGTISGCGASPDTPRDAPVSVDRRTLFYLEKDGIDGRQPFWGIRAMALDGTHTRWVGKVKLRYPYCPEWHSELNGYWFGDVGEDHGWLLAPDLTHFTPLSEGHGLAAPSTTPDCVLSILNDPKTGSPDSGLSPAPDGKTIIWGHAPAVGYPARSFLITHADDSGVCTTKPFTDLRNGESIAWLPDSSGFLRQLNDLRTLHWDGGRFILYTPQGVRVAFVGNPPLTAGPTRVWVL